MRTMTRSEAAAFLGNADRFTILTHRRPDGDTLGSAALLCRGLRALGKTAHILENPEITERYVNLHEGLTKTSPEAGDTLIAVDTASPGMLPEAFAKYGNHIALRLDHHGSATSFTEYELVEPHTAACGELIWGVLALMGVKLDIPMADALYTAISTDTGCFRYANTTADTFQAAAQCAAVSPNLFRLNQELFETNSLGRLRLQGWIVEHALFLEEGKAAICALPLSVERELGLTEDDLENISGFPRTIAGVKIAATLRENPDGLIKLSVRCVPEYNASAICEKFGGGGHRGAAGASMQLSMDEAVNAVRKAIEESL